MLEKPHIEVEYGIIYLMLTSLSVVGEVIESGYSLDFFSEENRPLVNEIFEEYLSSNQQRILTRETYRHRLKLVGDKDMPGKLKGYDRCFHAAEANVNDLGSLKNQLTDNYLAREVTSALQDFSQSSQFKHAGYKKPTRRLANRLHTILSITDTRKTIYASGRDLKKSYLQTIEEERKNIQTIIRCGIPEIDDAVNVGFRKQQLTLFVADVGSHKSNAMINIALNLVERGHKVLFIPLEMDHRSLLDRIISNRTGIDGSLVAHPEKLSEEDMQKINDSPIWEQMTRLYILDADERTSVATLKMEIESKAIAWQPNVVIIDYVDNLESDKQYGQRHIEIGDILKSLRFLGKKYEFHIISAAQMGRAAIKALREGKEEAVDSTAIHGSHQYAADSDTIFALMRVLNEPDKIRMLVLKARYGPSGGIKELRVDPSTGHISSTTDIMTTLSATGIDLNESLNQPVSEIETQLNFNNILNTPDLDNAPIKLN